MNANGENLSPPDGANASEEQATAALSRAHEALVRGQAALTDPSLSADSQSILRLNLSTLRLLDGELRQSSLTPAVSADVSPRYTLRRLHASGGVGEVWLARDNVLARDVALKQLRPEWTTDRRFVTRLVREAQVAGRLQHPGLAPVYELVDDPSAGDPFFTMRFVGGPTLGAAVRAYHQTPRRRRDSMQRLTLLNAFVSVCNTVAYAHSRGVIHRDLKSDNILLGEYGEVVVVDWGFAKLNGRCDDDGPDAGADLDDEAHDPCHTAVGAAVGTPAYMAPEQAESGGPIDERTDVYGLGAILYEILTGRPPHVGGDAHEVIRRARRGDVLPPEAVASGVPRPLGAVCRKALERDPSARYPNAAAVSREVQRWLADEPTEAYREPAADLVFRLARRHRVFAAFVIVLALATAAAVAAVGRSEARAALAMAAADAEARAEADRERAMIDRLRTAAERNSYHELVEGAERALDYDNVAKATAMLERCPPSGRAWEWYAIRQHCKSAPRVLTGHARPVTAVAIRPGRADVASVDDRSATLIHDMATGRSKFSLTGGRRPRALAYHPDGSRLAGIDPDGRLTIWDADTGMVVGTGSSPITRLEALSYSPDGRRLLAHGGLRAVLWDGGACRVLRTSPNTWPVRCSLFAADGSALVVLGRPDGSVLMNLDDPAEQGLRLGTDAVPSSMVVSPDGTQLAATLDEIDPRGPYGSVDPDCRANVVLYDRRTGRELHRLSGHSREVSAIAYSPDGRRLASASRDGTVRLWDPATGEEVVTLGGTRRQVRSLAFSRDGRRLVAGCGDGQIWTWESDPLNPFPAFQLQSMAAHVGRVVGIGWTTDGRLTSVGADGRACLWDAEAGTPIAGATVDRCLPEAATTSPDGSQIAVGCRDGEVVLLDPATLRISSRWPAHTGPIYGLSYNRDGRELASAGRDGRIRLWNSRSGEPTHSFKGHNGAVMGVAFASDGSLYSAGWDRTLRHWGRSDSTDPIAVAWQIEPFRFVAVSPDAKLVLSSGGEGHVRCWYGAGMKSCLDIGAHEGVVWGGAFAFDGRICATVAADWTIKIWKARPGGNFGSARTLRGHAAPVHCIAISPDGRRIATADSDGVLKIWDMADLLAP